MNTLRVGPHNEHSFLALRISFVSLLLCALMAVSCAAASAGTPGPGWQIDSVAAPTDFSQSENAACPGKEYAGAYCDRYEVSAMNTGSEPTDTPVTLTDTLPAEVSAAEVVLLLINNGNTHSRNTGGRVGGETVGDVGSCALVPVECTFSGVVAPDDWLRMVVYVSVDEGASGELRNLATVSGGGAASASTAEPGQMQQVNEISATPAPFGLANFSFFKASLNGSQETQAGGHPYAVTTTIDLNSDIRDEPGQGSGKDEGIASSTEHPKDIVVDLPLGFAGSTLAAPQCTEAELDSSTGCPTDTVVGHLTTEPLSQGPAVNSPIWNITPEYGHPAEFGYVDTVKSTHIAGYVSVVPTPAGYLLQFVAPDIPEILLNRLVVTFYGDPAEEQAETRQLQAERELEEAGVSSPYVGREVPGAQVPFFTNPTACSGGPQVAKVWMDSWRDPARFNPGTLVPTNLEEPQWVKAESGSPVVSGCDALSFAPALGVQPTTREPDSPSGLEFETRLAQSEVFGTDATPALKNLTVAFPQGMTVDPSSGNGLGACSEAQIGWVGPTLFDFTQGPPACPEASKVGTLELETPLIPGVLQGEVFLASQNENPFGSTFAIYVVVNDPATGVVLKIPGELKANSQTGQLTSVFDENPQLPFSVLKVHFFGGPRAELATPASCGMYTTTSVMEPWSAPDSGPAGTPFDDYVIDEGCATGFAPSFSALTSNLQAGAYTPFVASFSREDDDQELGGLSVSLPPGLLADVGSVPECGEAQIHEAEVGSGECPQSTQVGTILAEAGPGPNPLAVGGKVYLTGAYNGGPYGLVVVTPAVAGPFHFGNVVVRQSLRINPFTAAVTDVSDPFPTFLDPRATNGQLSGVPIKLRRINVEINRPGFTFNPTSCNKLQVSGAITSTQGASSALAVPFQITNCQTLQFAPKFSVSTSGTTSKADGASLTAKVSYPSAPQGTYADIARVKVELPKVLPSRLTTLQKACTAKQFEANPAGCPPGSFIGHATVKTPILAAALTGPAIFVSHGGEAFPSLEVVLQGDGVTIELVGSTFISKAGVTSTTFKTVPDSPFTSFELTLPEGPYSALAANANLCTQKLAMPNEFTAQNGDTIHQTTPITVTGCKKPTLTRSQQLTKALKTCKKDHKQNKRAKCEKAARSRYRISTTAEKGKRKS